MTEKRYQALGALIVDAGKMMETARDAADPLDQRRWSVRAASKLREAADLLDNKGRMKE